MKNYHIFTNPLGKHEAVYQGWSWMAFLFFWGYALVKGRWQLGLLTVVIYTPLSYVLISIAMGASSPLAYFIVLGINLAIWAYLIRIYGNNGHYWREEKLLRTGYEHVASIEAETADGAIAKHMRGTKTDV